MHEQCSADAAADMVRLDEQLVQVQRARRVTTRGCDGDLPIDPGRAHTSPAAISFGVDLKGGGHQRREPRIVAHTAFERKQRFDSKSLPRPEPAGCKMSGASAVGQAPARPPATSIGRAEHRRAGTTGSPARHRLVEGCGQRLLAGLVTTAVTGKDRDPGDPAREKFRAPSLDPEDGPMPNVAVRKSVRGQR